MPQPACQVFCTHAARGEPSGCNLHSNSRRNPKRRVLSGMSDREFHVRAASRLRALAANTTTAVIKVRLLAHAVEHEQRAGTVQRGVRLMAYAGWRPGIEAVPTASMERSVSNG